ncbi:porin [Bartonella sp. F02]|uniref:porin n=1 Tax=Bartonella sp. F02 TaxID=2967262 RepID=UPI0022A98F4F|nr:porin [Bartonella sp. F02]MCZ2328516.1 porin [Bartonella sp. F02]
MNIKVLFLGSATVFAGIYGAQATSTIPEKQSSIEYVRVCDAYGKGYFYIPGTETCIRLSGNVRADFSTGDNIDASTNADLADKNKSYNAKSRLTLVFQSASETELGTLRSYARMRAQWANGKDSITGQLSAAYIELGGFRVGLDSTIFDSWIGGYGNVFNDDLIAPSGATRTNFVSYTLNSDTGFSAIAGLELGNNSGDSKDVYYYIDKDEKIAPIAGGNLPTPSKKITGRMPNVLFGVKFMQAWGGVSAITAYDAYYKKMAGKLRLDYNINDRFNIWAVGGYKDNVDYYTADEHDVLSRHNTTMYANWGGKWAAWAGTTYKVTPQANFNAQISYSAVKTFAASANIAYTLVPGFVITPELSYISWNDDRTFTNKSGNKNYQQALNGKHAFQAMIRLQRSF